MASKLQACRYLLSLPPTCRSHSATPMTNSLSRRRGAPAAGEDERTSRGTFNGLFPFNSESAVPGQLVLLCLNVTPVTLEMDSLKAMCGTCPGWPARSDSPLRVFCASSSVVLEPQQPLAPGQAGPCPAPSSRCRCVKVRAGILAPAGISAEIFPAWSYAGAAFHT